jgi:hypothetical protein
VVDVLDHNVTKLNNIIIPSKKKVTGFKKLFPHHFNICKSFNFMGSTMGRQIFCNMNLKWKEAKMLKSNCNMNLKWKEAKMLKSNCKVVVVQSLDVVGFVIKWFHLPKQIKEVSS